MFFAINIILALIWTGLLGTFDFYTFTSGILIGYAFLFLIYHKHRYARPYFFRPIRIIGFLFYYMKELIRSNIMVATDIIRPNPRYKPGVIAVPITVKTSLEINLLANLITMTPGTITLDVSPDQKTLYVHAMYLDDPEAVRKDITENLERRIHQMLVNH